MRVLNLYAGLGGNRRLWTGCDVVAVELQDDIAKFYSDHYPDDEVIVGDAHEYLLSHYNEFDFIWASPPCPSHSRARFWGNQKTNPVYPDMKLYEEILLLKHSFDGLWVIENVKPYYEPLISPSVTLGRHHFWCNFHIEYYSATDADINRGTREDYQKTHDIDISGYKFKDRTDKILRNCVHYELGCISISVLRAYQTLLTRRHCLSMCPMLILWGYR